MKKYLISLILCVGANNIRPLMSQSLSPRNANYDISVTLNPVTKRLEGKEVLTWRNLSKDVVKDLQFHLYLNAFKDTKSTFVTESGGKLRGDAMDKNDKEAWGWTTVTSMTRLDTGEKLTSTFIHPDDDNTQDQTVISVPLSHPIPAGGEIKLAITWTAKLPKVFARTGFSDDFFLVGQWFPKIGVYEAAGQRYATKGAWNCHQFHANSEFYADYGVYNVDMTVPKDFVVGATGVLQKEILNKNQTKTYTYHAHDVIDFAWTASPKYQVFEDRWQQVKLRLLMQPEHANQAKRHFEAAKAALAYFDKVMGKYPYPNLTIIDPPVSGSGAGGMEYPTFITAGTFWQCPEGIKYPEAVTVHEFGHQYFMGLLASNEFEEPWLDEGFNQYLESRIMDATYGEKKSVINVLDYHFGDTEFARDSYVHSENPKIAENFRSSWQYTEGGYGMITYMKTATWMHTLDRLVGRKTMDEILKTYFERWRFKHPCAKDFIAIVNEKVVKKHDPDLGKNMNWFFEQVLYGTNICDYKLASAKSVQQGKDAKGKPQYQTKVEVERLGEVIMPVEVAVHFEDDSEISVYWDGKERSTTFSFNRPSKVLWAKIDPEHKLLIDVNYLNNSVSEEAPTSPFWKYFAKFLFWIQTLL